MKKILVLEDEASIRSFIVINLRRAGYEVKTRDFTRIGIPFTLAAVIPAYLYFWLIYA